MKRKKAAGLFCIVFTLVCLFLSGRANNDLGLFSDTHSTAGIIPEYVREGTPLSFLLLAVALAVSLICFCLYQYKKVPGAAAVVQFIIVLTICVYSLFMSILCICCMNGYRTEGLTASGSPAVSAPEMRESFALYLEPDELKKSAELTGQLKELGVSFGTEDMRALFADEMRTQRKRWEKEQEALEAAAEELTWRMDRYQYALQKGYAPTEEEIDGRLEEITARIREAPNFAELETALKECGTTCEQYLQDRRELYRISLAEEKLYAAAYEEFRLGNDRIGDRVCGDFAEYWTYYLLDVVYPAMESYNETTLEPLLKEAEAFYIGG